MAVLALAAVGAAIAPAGYAAIGWTIGSALGSALFAKKQSVTQEGPRLADLSVQTSTDGAPILEMFGTARCAGNILWSAGIRETKTESSEEVGGKGGGGTTVNTTTYSYSCSFALSLCKGPIVGVRRIWADGKLIYSAAATGDPEVIAASSALLDHMTIYLGTESQLPDPVIESYKGGGNVPAYRGQAYLVFQDLALADFGNRIPNFTAEVVAAGTMTRLRRIEAWTRPSESIAFDGGTIVAQSTQYTSGSTFAHRLRRYTFGGTLIEDKSTTLPTLDADTGPSFVLCRSNPDLFVIKRNGAGSANVSALYYRGAQIARPILPAMYDNTYYSVTSDMVYHDGYFYARGWNPSTGAVWIARYPLREEVQAFSAASITPVAHVLITADANTQFQLAVDSRGDVYAYFNSGELRQYDPQLTLVATWTGVPQDALSYFAVVNGRAYLHYIDHTLREYLLPAGGGTAVQNYSIALQSSRAGPLILNDSLLFDGDGIVSLLDEVAPNTATLASVVTAIAQSAGLQSTEINVAALSGGVDGYVLTQPMTARAALEPLMRAHFFDAIESGNVIKFVPRGGSSAKTISVSDLAAHADGESLPDAISIERVQERELPREVIVLYMDAAADYQQGSQSARRLVTQGKDSVTVELAMVLTADRARRIAEVLLADAWMSRRSYPLSLPPKYIEVEPTDVITLLDVGATHTVRVVDQEIGANGVIRCHAVAESAVAYTSTATGAPAAITSQSIALAGPTALQMLDIPILRDIDDTPGCYLAAAGYLGGWQGAVIQQSRDAGESWAAVDSKLTAAPMGFATTALAAPAEMRLWDRVGSVNVRLLGGTLASSTDEGVIGGANLALLGAAGRWELLHFRDAVLEANGTWTLRSFLRGCFGTEYAAPLHAANDVFILVTSTSLLRMLQAQGDIGLALMYRAVSIGAPAYTPATVNFSNTGVSQRPYPVNGLAGIKQSNGDWLIQWSPRVRKRQSWMQIASIAADAAISGYQLDIMSGSTVKRSIYVTGATSFTYPLASQSADFGAGQSTVKVRVYAHNTQVGLGHGVEITAPDTAETYLAPAAFTATAYGAPVLAGPTDPQGQPATATTYSLMAMHYYDGGYFYGHARDNAGKSHLVVGDSTASTWEVRGAMDIGINRGAKTSSYHGYFVNHWFARSANAADGTWTYYERKVHPLRNIGGGTFYDMVSDGTRFICCGSVGILESTTDFVTWTELAVAQFGTNIEFSVIRFGNGAYLLHGVENISGVLTRKVWRSTDRQTWTDVSPAGFANHRIMDLLYAGGKWVMVGSKPNQYQQSLPVIWTSTDNGLTWVEQNAGGVPEQNAAFIVHNGTTFVVTGFKYRASSTDAATWTAVVDTSMTNQGRMVANGSLLVAISYPDSVIRKSTDAGATWTTIQ